MQKTFYFDHAATTAVKVVRGTGNAKIWPFIVVFDLTLLIGRILTIYNSSL